MISHRHPPLTLTTSQRIFFSLISVMTDKCEMITATLRMAVWWCGSATVDFPKEAAISRSSMIRSIFASFRCLAEPSQLQTRGANQSNIVLTALETTAQHKVFVGNELMLESRTRNIGALLLTSWLLDASEGLDFRDASVSFCLLCCGAVVEQTQDNPLVRCDTTYQSHTTQSLTELAIEIKSIGPSS